MRKEFQASKRLGVARAVVCCCGSSQVHCLEKMGQAGTAAGLFFLLGEAYLML